MTGQVPPSHLLLHVPISNACILSHGYAVNLQDEFERESVK